jgi:hypothetical protein
MRPFEILLRTIDVKEEGCVEKTLGLELKGPITRDFAFGTRKASG